MIDFAGKIVLVTGGGVGIGRGTCEAFAKAGATVVTIEKDAGRAADVRAALGDKHLVVDGDGQKIGEALPEPTARPHAGAGQPVDGSLQGFAVSGELLDALEGKDLAGDGGQCDSLYSGGR